MSNPDIDINAPYGRKLDGTPRKIPLTQKRLESLKKARQIKAEKARVRKILRLEKEMKKTYAEGGNMNPEPIQINITPPPPPMPVNSVKTYVPPPISTEQAYVPSGPKENLITNPVAKPNISWLESIIDEPKPEEQTGLSLIEEVKNFCHRKKDRGLEIIWNNKIRTGIVLTGISAFLYLKFKSPEKLATETF